MPVSLSGPGLRETVVATLMAITIGVPIGVPIGATIAAVSLSAQTPAGTPYLDIITRYRDGTDDAAEKAIGELAALPDGHSREAVLKEFERIAFRLGIHETAAGVTRERRVRLADAWADLLPAAAVIHLETGFVLLEHDDKDRALSHLSIARVIVDWPGWESVTRYRSDMVERHASLRRDIYIGIVWTLQGYRLLDQLLPHLERTRDQLPDDPIVKLAFGSFEELKATVVEIGRLMPPSSHVNIPVDVWRRQSQHARLDKAIDHYRDALKTDPSLTEARLRLGRALRLRGKMREARQELEAVVASTVPSTLSSTPPALPAFGPRMVVPYLGAMFLAETIELGGDAAGALTLYQDIARRWPECQSGLLALSRAYEARGDREAALDTLRMLHRDQAKRQCVDPWWTYNLGQAWRFGPFIVDLRARVKGRS